MTYRGVWACANDTCGSNEPPEVGTTPTMVKHLHHQIIIQISRSPSPPSDPDTNTAAPNCPETHEQQSIVNRCCTICSALHLPWKKTQTRESKSHIFKQRNACKRRMHPCHISILLSHLFFASDNVRNRRMCALECVNVCRRMNRVWLCTFAGSRTFCSNEFFKSSHKLFSCCTHKYQTRTKHTVPEITANNELKTKTKNTNKKITKYLDSPHNHIRSAQFSLQLNSMSNENVSYCCFQAMLYLCVRIVLNVSCVYLFLCFRCVVHRACRPKNVPAVGGVVVDRMA